MRIEMVIEILKLKGFKQTQFDEKVLNRFEKEEITQYEKEEINQYEKEEITQYEKEEINQYEKEEINQYEKEEINQFEERNIDIWINDSRIIMLKQYITQNSLLDWKMNDQASIATMLSYFPKKYLNNLYFFMILDFNPEDTKVRLKINEIEKDDLICKKYVLKNDEDLNRIPFLMDLSIENNTFAFDKKFKKRFMEFKDSITPEDTFNLDKIMEDFFDNYLNNKSTNKIKIENLLDIGD